MGIVYTFLINRAEIFYDNSRDYYLLIGYEKTWIWALLAIFDILGLKKRVAPQILIRVWDI